MPGLAGKDGRTGTKGERGQQGMPGPTGRDGPAGMTWLARGQYRIDLKEKTDEIAILRGALAASRAETSELKSTVTTLSATIKAMMRSLTTRGQLTDLEPDLIFKVALLPDLPKSDAEPREASAEAEPPDA